MSEYYSVMAGSVYKTVKNIKKQKQKKHNPKPPIWKRPSKLKSFIFNKRKKELKKVSSLSVRINNKLTINTNLPYYPPKIHNKRYNK